MTDRSRGDRRLIFRPDLDGNPQHADLWADRAPADERRLRLAERLRGVMDAALTDKQRTAVELYFFEGLTQQQIAARLGVSQQVIHRRLYGDVRGGRPVGGALPRLKAALTAGGL